MGSAVMKGGEEGRMTIQLEQGAKYRGAAGGPETTVIAPLSGQALRWRSIDSRPEVVVSLPDSTPSALLARATPTGVAAYCMVFPVISVGVLAASNPGFTRAGWAIASTCVFSPIYLRHVRYFIRGLRPPAAGWTLTVMTVVMFGTVPLAGGWWLPMFFALAVSLLTTLPWRWSLAGVTALALAQVPLALSFPAPEFPVVASEPSYFVLDLLWRTAAVFVPVWLIRAVRQLDAARRELADAAVLRERLDVDTRLRGTVGAALGSIAARSQRAAALAQADPGSAGPQLTALIEISRGALAETRRLLSGLHQPSLRAELETAASLLTAAGIDTQLALPAADPPGHVSAAFRSQLRSATARLLRDESARTCALALTSAGGQARLDIRVDGRHLASMEVAVS
jgi:two-component system, NarL family, sensor histidine kinase DesK